jgi:hypothetical protein
VSIEVSEEMVVVLGRISKSLPLADVEGKEGFVGVTIGRAVNAEKVLGKILAKKSVEFFSQQVSSTMTLTECV